MENYLQSISVPAIVTTVYWIIAIMKYTINGKEIFNRLIPLISCCTGIVCGVIVFYGMPEIIPAENVLTAIIIGAASGLSATGINQIFKQKTKPKETHESVNKIKKSNKKK